MSHPDAISAYSRSMPPRPRAAAPFAPLDARTRAPCRRWSRQPPQLTCWDCQPPRRSFPPRHSSRNTSPARRTHATASSLVEVRGQRGRAVRGTGPPARRSAGTAT
eukprot:CAMPEP_0203815144 /NCGR_PEP_ID=MMETSP0115-20131106/7966_1 /ASSEMBLY_ACC=CAM_ASM_000227 /TAXON_ID=33651 /ORGANISM="Bicosoecid sp, Strain ms1" /LENGTH=105 /DNA_ID=CAMNT_0050724037 /DNA_START=64 /DNA_END=378 /DNA_ORIENTATION=-